MSEPIPPNFEDEPSPSPLDTPGSVVHAYSEQEFAFTELYEQIAPLLRMLARRRFRVPQEDVDTVVNDVFVSYLRDPAHIDNPRQYLVGAICNASRAYQRRKSAEHGRFVPIDAPPASDDPTFESLATTLAVGTMLSQMSSGCRDMLYRAFVENKSREAIALEMDTSAGAIRVRLHKCRQRAQQIFCAITKAPRPHAP